MSGSRKVLFLILIMVVTSLTATGTGLALLYQTSFEQTRNRLVDTAHSQAELIDAVARFDRQFSQTDNPGGALGATISQIKEAHSQFTGLGETGEIIMARLEGDRIHFVLRQRHTTAQQTMSISLASKRAEPMRRALAGERGSVVGLDYRGATVLAAYEPVTRLEMGIVAKIDVTELRAPFIRAGLIASLIALLLITLGAVLFLRIGGSMARQVTASRTKTKEIESELILSENRYRDLYEEAEVAIFEEDFSQLWKRLEQYREDGVVDLCSQLNSGRISAQSLASLVVIKDVNKAALELFGADSKELLLTSIEEIFVPSAMEIFKEELYAIWQEEDNFRSEAEHRTLQGDHLQVIISMPVPRSLEAALSVPVTIIDVTKQRETEETLRRSQKMDAIGQLAGGIAHDFNNLMAIMMGHSEILGTIVGPNDRAQQSIRALTQSVERGASLTRRLLTFSRQQAYESTVADLGDLVKGLQDLLARTLGETVDLIIDTEAEIWPTRIDINQLEHAIINLALNSLDAMPKGGQLTIRATNRTIRETKSGKFRDMPPGDYIEVEVTDTGCGITRENMERVFDPFFTTKEFGQGTGLGLSTVYGFVRQSMGYILLDSKLGHGTSFQILLPRYRGSLAINPPTESKASRIPGGTERILVVEDDSSVRGIAVEILINKGYQVVEASTGSEAIQLLEISPPFDLLFTDVVLPGGIDGLEIARRASSLQSDIVVLFTTGYARDAILRHGSAAHCTATINKPYRAVDLLIATRKILDRRAAGKIAD